MSITTQPFGKSSEQNPCPKALHMQVSVHLFDKMCAIALHDINVRRKYSFKILIKIMKIKKAIHLKFEISSF